MTTQTKGPEREIEPEQAGSLPPARLWWGYGVWLFVGAVIGTCEIWAAAGNPWWPTISATIGHLERLWNPTKIIVVALLAAAAVEVLQYPPQRGQPSPLDRRGRPWRTSGGRRTRQGPSQAEQPVLPYLYFPAAVAATAAAGASAAVLGGGTFAVGYAIYGVIAAAFLIIPNALAFGWKKEVPFPTLFTTLGDLDRRSHLAVLVIIAGLVVLAIHLLAYPWP